MSPEVSGDQLRLAIVESIAAILTVASTSRPCTLLLEDWHWADEASMAALLQLCELIPSFPIMVVVTHRPGYGVTWPSMPHHRHLPLAPLDGGHTRDIVVSALRAEEVDEELAGRIQDRAQGNPFFVEEMCAALLEQGAIEVHEGRARLTAEADDLTLPDSVQAVIRTRLDRMTPATREVLSAASVVGREFTRELVDRALGGAPDLEGALHRLRTGGLIQQTRLVPTATYRFKHALIQEVTYETLLGQQRRVLHRRVGEAMEDLVPSNEEDRPFERLSDHFFRAEVWDKSVDYALGAGRRASRLSQIPEALRALEVAEAALAHIPEHLTLQRQLDVLLMKERLSETTGERRQQRRIISELRPLVTRSGDVALEAEVLVRAGDLEISLRNYEEAESVLREAVDKASQADDTAMHRKALRSLGLLRWHQDRNEEALDILQGVLEEDETAGDTEGMILDHHNLGSVYRSMGNIDRALELAQESVRLAEDSPFRQVYALHTVAQCQRGLGRMEDAISTWQDGIQLCEQHHLPLQGSYLTTSLAHLYLQMGRTDESVSLYEHAVERTRRVRHAEGIARAVSALARVLEGLGRDEEALGYWNEAVSWFGRMEEHDRQAHAQSRVAAILEGSGEAQQALAAWGKAHQMAGEAGHDDLEIESLTALARLTREHLGTVRLALPYYESALQIAQRRGWRTREGVILNSLGVVAWEAGDYEGARERYASAVACFEGTERTTAWGHALNSLGQTLRKLGRLDEARDTLEEAVALHRDTGNARLEGYALAALGDTYLDKEQPRLALAAFENSLGIRHVIGDRRGAGWMAERMAKSAHQLGQLDRVRELLSEATLIADQLEDRELQEACSRLRP
ncbi:MAG: tetratricopeptide repeat protein [Gemmatimonadetes bacterium]|nr:tetratricopeptide repeat protein [Gemmatimonadota bacterium]